MQPIEIASALDIDRSFVERRIARLQRELEICRSFLEALDGGAPREEAVPEMVRAIISPPTLFSSSESKGQRLTRRDYYDPAVAFLARHPSAMPREIYESLRQRCLPVTADSVAAFLRRELTLFRRKSRIIRDPARPGHYMLRPH